MDLGSFKAQGANSAWGTEDINSLTPLPMSPKIEEFDGSLNVVSLSQDTSEQLHAIIGSMCGSKQTNVTA